MATAIPNCRNRPPRPGRVEVRPVRVIVLVLVLVLDFLISAFGFLSAFGIRVSFGFKPRLMGGGGEEFEDEDENEGERKGGATPEKNHLTTDPFIPTVR